MERKREFFTFIGLGVSDRKLAETFSRLRLRANKTIGPFVELLCRRVVER